MKYYFSLQFTRTKRWFEELGLDPWLGMAISVVLFIIGSHFLFVKTELASWIYILLAGSIVANFSEKQRNDQLRLLYNKATRLKVRLIENGIVVLPYLLFLLYKGGYLFVVGLMVVAILLALFDFRKTATWVLPTPFRRFPFEFIVGFRKSYFIILLIYFLIGKAIQVDNFNLGVVSFGVLFLICMSFYLKPEPSYFVWVHADSPDSFLNLRVGSVC